MDSKLSNRVLIEGIWKKLSEDPSLSHDDIIESIDNCGKTINKHFKEAVGITLVDYIKRHRFILVAKNYLQFKEQFKEEEKGTCKVFFDYYSEEFDDGYIEFYTSEATFNNHIKKFTKSKNAKTLTREELSGFENEFQKIVVRFKKSSKHNEKMNEVNLNKNIIKENEHMSESIVIKGNANAISDVYSCVSIFFEKCRVCNDVDELYEYLNNVFCRVKGSKYAIPESVYSELNDLLYYALALLYKKKISEKFEEFFDIDGILDYEYDEDEVNILISKATEYILEFFDETDIKYKYGEFDLYYAQFKNFVRDMYDAYIDGKLISCGDNILSVSYLIDRAYERLNQIFDGRVRVIWESEGK